MEIGLVGAGNIGSALAQNLVALGHDVALANSRGPETLTGLVEELGPRARAVTIVDAAQFGDLTVVTIPLVAVPELPADAFDGRTVVDTCNYYPGRDGTIEELGPGGGLTESEWVARHLPGATIVKAFNSIPAADLAAQGNPSIAPGQRRGIPIAGDDARAKQTVAQLIDQMGFDPVDAGPLSAGGQFENGADLYGAPLAGAELGERLGVA